MCSKILRMTAFLSINLATINNCFHANYTYKFYTRIHIIYSAFLKVFVKANVSQLQNSVCILLKNNQLWNLRRNISQDASRCTFIYFFHNFNFNKRENGVVALLFNNYARTFN